MKKIRRITSLVLSLCMILSLVAFADNTSEKMKGIDRLPTSELVETAKEEIAAISELMSDRNIEIIGVDETGDITYLIESEFCPETEMTIGLGDDGSITLFFSEGEIEDELIIFPDGRVYLDGNEVIHTVTTSDPPSIIPTSRWTMYDDEPIIGTAEDYNIYLETKSGNIESQEKWINLTIGAIVSLLTLFVPGLSTMPNPMIEFLAGYIKSEALVKGPDSSFITYRIDVYKYNGLTGLDRHEKNVGKYYYTDSYSGPYTTYTYYYANMFS